jgi:hypothetical protein
LVSDPPPGRQSAIGRLAGRLLFWLDRLQIWLVVAVFVLLGVSLIDPVRKVLERYVTLDADFSAWVVAGMFVVTLAILRQLETAAPSPPRLPPGQFRALFRNSIQHLERVGERVVPTGGGEPTRRAPDREPAARPSGDEGS